MLRSFIDTIHTPFSRAVTANEFKEVERLLPTADVNWQGIWGNTPLHWAVANSNVNMILYLLEQAPGLNVNIKEGKGKTALHMAIAKGWYHFDTGESKVSKEHEPPQAVAIQALIERTQVDLQDNDGNTPLHIAVMRRDLVAIEALLKKGASIDIKNNKGQTPVDIQKLSYSEVKRFLFTYVYVYSINKKIWDESSRSLATYLPLAEIDEVKDSPDEKPITPNGMNDLLEEKIIESFPVIFDQAIFLLEDLIQPVNVEAKAQDRPQEIVTPATDMLTALQKLKYQTLDEFNNSKLSFSQANILAKSVLVLSLKTASLTLTAQDINNFKTETAPYVKSSVLGKIISTIIGALVGVFVGIMAGLASGPGAAVTGLIGGVKGAVIGASVGGVVGSGVGFWGAKKIINRNNSLKELKDSAETINRALIRV